MIAKIVTPIVHFAFAIISRPSLCFLSLIGSVIAVGALVSAWQAWQAHSYWVEQDNIVYDNCLVANGNVPACEALLRIRARARAAK